MFILDRYTVTFTNIFIYILGGFGSATRPLVVNAHGNHPLPDTAEFDTVPKYVVSSLVEEIRKISRRCM